MHLITVNTVLTKFAFRSGIMRGITQNIPLMESLSKHRMELAKERLRAKLSFEYITQLPHYKELTREQYEILISGIEAISMVLLQSFIKRATLLLTNYY